ncbi:lysophospholipid acyltransferase 1 isoform X5 [Heterocephalus glaber]|uniref:Lysophospholipid acyltransferase 1 isoform X5 n=1 Tax=Heterocephalus glaber TaxID=10181 RepID=A0AAX6T3X7_HETGA|nr:lysophospholipid acyltransferase 1 isoform X5 [Heterocephalus glaber]
MAAEAPPAGLSPRTTGSTCLHPLSELLRIPLDQVNFVACQLFALFAAFWFRIYLHPGKTSSEVRHAIATILGIYFVIFCFGWYSIHLFVLVLLCYGIMVTTSVSNIHRYTFFVAMGYLTICHISRIYIFHYGILTTDFSGPLMIVTQKITALAFQVHDGLGRRAEDLSAEQHRLAVKVKPSLLEYLSYLLNFMSVIAGPCNNFKDYVAFIEGRHTHMKLLGVNWKQKGFHSLLEPSPNTATSLKIYLENWNIQTAAWLKCVCYERTPWYPTVLTFVLSALWHGVYPGYYFTFLTGVLVTLAARAVRNNYRQHFHSSKALKVVYDVVTWATTQLAVSYIAAPFVMLAVEPTISLYKSMYFYLHIISLLVILFLPIKPQAHAPRQPRTLNSVHKKKTD